jgi:hypothetical protein
VRAVVAVVDIGDAGDGAADADRVGTVAGVVVDVVGTAGAELAWTKPDPIDEGDVDERIRLRGSQHYNFVPYPFPPPHDERHPFLYCRILLITNELPHNQQD